MDDFFRYISSGGLLYRLERQLTCLFLIWCSICLAFFGVLPKRRIPLVSRSSLCIVLKFFRLYSLARMKTTVLCRYLPHGCTCNTRNVREIYLPRKQKRERKREMIREGIVQLVGFCSVKNIERKACEKSGQGLLYYCICGRTGSDGSIFICFKTFHILGTISIYLCINSLNSF